MPTVAVSIYSSLMIFNLGLSIQCKKVGGAATTGSSAAL
jgi:hypothetical protein